MIHFPSSAHGLLVNPYCTLNWKYGLPKDLTMLSSSQSEQMIVISLCGSKAVLMRNAFQDNNIGFVKVCEVSDIISMADIRLFEGPNSKNCIHTVMCMKIIGT